MSDGAEREHAATAKRRSEFAKRGEVVQSRDLIGAAVLLMGSVALYNFGHRMVASILGIMRLCLNDLHHALTSQVFYTVGHQFAVQVVPLAALSCLAAILAGLLMHKGQLPFRAPSFNLGRINPASKLFSLFSPKNFFLLITQNGLKIIGLGVVLWVTMSGPVTSFVSQTPASLQLGLRDAGFVLERVVWRSLLAIVGFALLDWGFNWWRLEKQMRMSTQEMRDESKEDNGDPRLRGKRRRIASQLIKSISPDAIRKADVIIVNPTHYAVAVLYQDKMQAPKVVAKGVDTVAERIRSVARQAQVPIVSQPPLARLLYAKVKVGRSIPQETWQAVAVVLAHVYRLKKKV